MSYKTWRHRIGCMLPHDQGLLLESLEKRHGKVAVVRCRKGKFTAECNGEVIDLETVGQRSVPVAR
jgi:hypothetical protein